VSAGPGGRADPSRRHPFAFVDEEAKREIRRKLLKAVAIPGYQVPFASRETAAALVRAIAAFGRRRALVRHHAHVRFEVSNGTALPLVADLIDEGAVGMLSFMDHTPGQGQYRDPRRYREYVRMTYWAAEEEVDRIVAEKLAGRALVREEELRALADLAEAAWVPVAGHDPDTVDAVDRAVERGAGLVEFPVTLDVARYASDCGVHVCVGAPNVLHGRSHDANLSAREAIGADAADVLCSDYYPAGLLQAVFALGRDGACTLPEAVAMATANAATAAGLQNVAGVIAPGWRADLLLVTDEDGRPTVQATVVGGELALAVGRGTHAPAAPVPVLPGWPADSAGGTRPRPTGRATTPAPHGRPVRCHGDHPVERALDDRPGAPAASRSRSPRRCPCGGPRAGGGAEPTASCWRRGPGGRRRSRRRGLGGGREASPLRRARRRAQAVARLQSAPAQAERGASAHRARRNGRVRAAAPRRAPRPTIQPAAASALARSFSRALSDRPARSRCARAASGAHPSSARRSPSSSTVRSSSCPRTGMTPGTRSIGESA
jgi:phosphonate metabolism protein PhnM